MERGLFTLHKAPAVGDSIDRKWRKGKRRREGESRGAINLSPSFTILQWIAAVAADKNWAFFLSFFLHGWLSAVRCPGGGMITTEKRERGHSQGGKEEEEEEVEEEKRESASREKGWEDEVQIRGQWEKERGKHGGEGRWDMKETMRVRRQGHEGQHC